MTRGRIAVVVAVIAGFAACARILGIRDPEPMPFDHRAHVVEGVSCLRCHDGIDRAGDDAPLHLPDTGTCISCHTEPHDTRACLGCHGGRYTAMEAAQDREHLRFSHRAHLERVPGQCVRCHAGVAQAGSRLRVHISACLGCHDQGAASPIRRCQSCHVDVPDQVRPPDSHIVHGDDFARDHGPFATSSAELCASCHRESFCAGCHGANVPALTSRFFPADPLRASVHRAGFRARHSEEARVQPGTCTTCHTEEWCASCHRDEGVAATPEEPRGSPHPPGWVGVGTSNAHGRAARRDPASCAACHGGAGEMLCVSCHRVGGIGGSPHPPGWSSRKGMRETPCRLCHTPLGGL